MKKTIFNCLYCGKEKLVYACWINEGMKFCSHKCSSNFRWRPEDVVFWSHVTKSDGCWLWDAYISPNGYGQFMQKDGNRTSAHRIAWKLTFGEIPNGLLVCHHCDNRKCVRPSHLFLGTHSDNTRDALSKDRLSRGSRNSNTKLTEEKVLEIKKMLTGKYGEQTLLAKKFSVSPEVIRLISKNKTWKHVQLNQTEVTP